VRERGDQVTDLLELAGMISTASANALMSRYAELARLTTVDPNAWIVTAAGRAPASLVMATVELRVVRADRSAAVIRYRSWP